jgi:hypothetical protein
MTETKSTTRDQEGRMPDRYATIDDRPFHSHYLYVETIIDHPIEKVWPHALLIDKWANNNHRYETVVDTGGGVGHLWRLYYQSVPEGTPEPHYSFTGITYVIPHKLVGYEVFPEKGGSYGGMIPLDYRGFDTMVVDDLGGRTKVAVLVISTSENPIDVGRSDEDRAAAFYAHFDNLRTLVDAG